MSSIQAAIDDLRSQEVPRYRPTARRHSVDHQTLRRQYLGICLSRAELHECQSLLNNKEVYALINEINRLSARRTPPTITIVRQFTFNIANRWPRIN
jgi:hypothetical protein